jgi:signal transduction histidine kinase
MLVLGGVVLLAGQFRDAFVNPSDVAAMFIFWVGPFLVGMGHRDATEKASRARVHAALADELRVRDTREAVARERSRIARELHDVVSHSLTVVTINAQAVRRSLPPDRAREIDALSAIETTARDAGVEMRRLLGVLRADEEDHALEPQPGLGDLPALAARLSGAGIRVAVDVSASAEHVATGLGVSIYRIVQEALTNVVRHAHATRAWVRVAGEGPDLLVEIEDDGVGDRRGSAVAGHGLVGITERAHVYGGTAQFGAGERGFLVRVRVPMLRVSA